MEIQKMSEEIIQGHNSVNEEFVTHIIGIRNALLADLEYLRPAASHLEKSLISVNEQIKITEDRLSVFESMQKEASAIVELHNRQPSAKGRPQ